MSILSSLRRGVVAVLTLLASGSLVLAPAAASESVGFYKKWAWFEDSYWIVPPEGIYSVFHVEAENKFVVDRGQTVFHITDYFNGYFTGTVVVKLTVNQIASCQYVLGQVTPEGRVFMTMYAAGTAPDPGTVVNYPVGQMVKRGRNWTMVNQMTSLAQGGTLSHWAYMVQSKPGSASFYKLPFADVSIPEFMQGCNENVRMINAFE